VSYAQVPQPISYLASLTDVLLTSPANGEVLTYQSSSGKWVNNPTVGSVTSVSNSDGTLTISPSTGAVVASLNLAHANTWTAAQTFSSLITANGGIARPKIQQSFLASDITTTSTTPVSTGVGITISSIPTTSVLAFGFVIGRNDTTANSAVEFFIYRSIVGIPAKGSAPAGGDVNLCSAQLSSPSTSSGRSIPLFALDVGLTAGTTYYYYIGWEVAVSGTTGHLQSGLGVNGGSVLIAEPV
jgi:hypothetical protein